MTVGLSPGGFNRDEHCYPHIRLDSRNTERKNTVHMTQCHLTLRRFSAEDSYHPGSAVPTSQQVSPTAGFCNTPTHPSRILCKPGMPLIPHPPLGSHSPGTCAPTSSCAPGPGPTLAYHSMAAWCRVQTFKTTTRNSRCSGSVGGPL